MDALLYEKESFGTKGKEINNYYILAMHFKYGFTNGFQLHRKEN